MSDHVLIDLIRLYYDALERVLKKTDSTPIDWGWELVSKCIWVNHEFGWILYSLGIGKDAKGKIFYQKKDSTRWITKVSGVNAWYVTPEITGHTKDYMDVASALAEVGKPHTEKHVWLRLHVGNDEKPDEFIVALDMAKAQYDTKIAMQKYPFAIKIEETVSPLFQPRGGYWISDISESVVPIKTILDETFEMSEIEELVNDKRAYPGYARRKMHEIAEFKHRHVTMRQAFCDLAKERGLNLFV